MRPTYQHTFNIKGHWSLPEALPGRRIFVAIWRWL